MNTLNRALGFVAVATLLGSTVAQAEGFGRRADCGGPRFGTCASGEVSVAGSRVSIGLARSFRFGPRDADLSTFTLALPSRADGPDGRYASLISEAGCVVPSGNPLDCPGTTITPEPVSMTLMATGLLGMSGMGWVRRRRLNRTV